MNLPPAGSPIWTDLITEKKNVQFGFLAVKIFLGMARMNYKTNPATLAQSAKELHALLEKNLDLPSVQKDIQQLS